MQVNNQISVSKKVDSHIQLAQPPILLQGINSDVLTMRYDPTGNQVAVGTINGDLKIYNSKTENTGLLNKNLVKPGENAHPISIIRWNPITTYYKYTN